MKKTQQKNSISPASLVMATGAVISCLAFLFAPESNMPAQIVSALCLSFFGAAFIVSEKFNF
jgi:hypothetical protein